MRWGLQPLTVRDATLNNLASALNIRQKRRKAPPMAVDPGPFGAPCAVPAAAPVGPAIELGDLAAVARSAGWPMP